jgi:hypothetical protein
MLEKNTNYNSSHFTKGQRMLPSTFYDVIMTSIPNKTGSNSVFFGRITDSSLPPLEKTSFSSIYELILVLLAELYKCNIFNSLKWLLHFNS